jgi:hypothetical protein
MRDASGDTMGTLGGNRRRAGPATGVGKMVAVAAKMVAVAAKTAADAATMVTATLATRTAATGTRRRVAVVMRVPSATKARTGTRSAIMIIGTHRRHGSRNK